MIKYRIKYNHCHCHPETCSHFKYTAEILVDDWIATNIRSDYASEVDRRVKAEHPTWIKECNEN